MGQCSCRVSKFRIEVTSEKNGSPSVFFTSILTLSDAEALFEDIRNQNEKSRECLSKYPIDMALASRDVKTATIESLSKNFDEEVLKYRDRDVYNASRPNGWKGDTELLETSLADNASE
jgi:hypothetical protein